MSTNRYSDTAHIAPYWPLIPRLSPMTPESRLMRTTLVSLCLVAAVVFAVIGQEAIATWLFIAAAVILVSYLVYNEVRTIRSS